MDLGIKGKVALVTGAARDVGRAIALQMGAEGAIVAVNYNSSAKEAEAVVEEIKGAGGTAKTYQADVGDNEEVKAMVAQIVADYGGLDILVNNAGYVKPTRFLKTNEEDWKKQIDVGLYGVIHCAHAAAPHMVEKGWGRIVTVAGDSARVGEVGLSITASSRGGAISLTKSLAKELGRDGITVNAVAFGLIGTTHSDQAWLAKNMDKILRNYPTGRIGEAEDIPPCVAFLCSQGASWLTGQVVSISGGYSMVG